MNKQFPDVSWFSPVAQRTRHVLRECISPIGWPSCYRRVVDGPYRYEMLGTAFVVRQENGSNFVNQIKKRKIM